MLILGFGLVKGKAFDTFGYRISTLLWLLNNLFFDEKSKSDQTTTCSPLQYYKEGDLNFGLVLGCDPEFLIDDTSHDSYFVSKLAHYFGF